MPEEEGFDPPDPFGTSVFKSDSTLKFSITASHQHKTLLDKIISYFSVES